MAGTTPAGVRPGVTSGPGRVKPLYVALGAGGIGGLALYMRHRASKKAADNPTPVTATDDTTVTDDFTQLQTEIGQLQKDEENEPLPSNNPRPSKNPPPKPKPIHGGKPPTGGKPPVKVPPPAPKPAPKPPPNPTPKPVAKTHVYKVRHGDTLWAIARRNGISLDELRRLNPVYWTNPKYQQGNMIWAGDSVVLPGAG